MATILVNNATMRDPVRPGPRVEIEIECLGTGTALPGVEGASRPGVRRIKVHEADLPKLQTMVEDKWEYVDQSIKFNDVAFREFLTRESRQSLEDVEKYLAGTLADQDAYSAIHKTRINYQGSWQAEFYELMRRVEGKPRGRKPLRYLKVIGPTEPELDPQQQGTVDVINQVRAAMAPLPTTDPHMLRTIEDLKTEIEQLKQSRRGPGRPRKDEAPEE